METRKIIAVSVFIVAVVAGGFVLYWQRETILNKRQNPESETQDQWQTIIVENKTIKDDTSPFKINITYPQVAGLDDFNKKSEEIANNELSEFKKISLENDQTVKEIDPVSYAEYPREYYLEINYDKGLINAEIISIVFNVFNYTGGAHGANYFVALNYNLKNNKEVYLSDLFPEQSNYLKTISDYCTEDLNKQIKERAGNDAGAWLEDGAGPNAENFSVFLINKNSITFYFPQYQIVAYALGDFKVVMPR